jgi:hypothetical protein
VYLEEEVENRTVRLAFVPYAEVREQGSILIGNPMIQHLLLIIK